MYRTAEIVLLGALVALPAARGMASERIGDRYGKQLSFGEQMDIGPLSLDRPATYKVACNSMHLTIRAAPGGLIQIVKSDVTTGVCILGTGGRMVAFELRPGEQASFWPIRRLQVRGRDKEFSLVATAADWAFVVRADRTLGAGLFVQCHDTSCTLTTGQRIDVDREGAKIVFRVIEDDWPGEVVRVRKLFPPQQERRDVPSVADAEETLPTPSLPFLATGWAAWEIKPAAPVSP